MVFGNLPLRGLIEYKSFYLNCETEGILLIYTSGLYINEGEDRVTVLHIENFTKLLYLVPQMCFLYFTFIHFLL